MNIVQIITTIVGYAASIALYIKGLLDKKKAKSDTQAMCETLNTQSNNITKLEILNKVSEYCAEAEKLIGSGNGPLKALYVTCKIESLANTEGVCLSHDDIVNAINSALSSPQAKTSEVINNDN